MCLKHCSEVCRERKDFCADCQLESVDNFEALFEITPTLSLEDMSAVELMEIEAKFREEQSEQ